MKTRKLFIYSLLVLLVGATSCMYNPVDGNGIRETENRVTPDFFISGSGDIVAANLYALGCLSRISGLGDMWISVEEQLEAKIPGSGNVFYYGQPQIEKNISGSGNIFKKN